MSTRFFAEQWFRQRDEEEAAEVAATNAAAKAAAKKASEEGAASHACAGPDAGYSASTKRATALWSCFKLESEYEVGGKSDNIGKIYSCIYDDEPVPSSKSKTLIKWGGKSGSTTPF